MKQIHVNSFYSVESCSKTTESQNKLQYPTNSLKISYVDFHLQPKT